MTLSGKRVLVTGADGFIGSHLVERLQEEGADIRALCVYNSNGSHGWLDSLPDVSSVEPVLGDIRDSGFVNNVCRDIQIVFHLAALIAIPYSYVAPRSYVETNVLGTLNVLDAARNHGVDTIVNTSTSEVYGTPDSVPITEAHAVKGQSPYSATKIAADKLCESYALSFGTPVVTLRPFNTYGPRQSRRAVIPTILAQLQSGQTAVRLGSLLPQRDFTYATDTADGFVRMATAALAPGSTVHLGTGSCVSIGDLFALCCDVTGVEAEAVADDQRIRPDGSEVDILLSDPSLAGELLGWTPQVSLLEGLARTAEWLADNPGRDAATYQR